MFFFKNKKIFQPASVTQTGKENRLREFSQLPVQEILESCRTTTVGLNTTTVAQRQESDGKNIIKSADTNTRMSRLIQALFDPFNLILMLIAVVTFVTDVVLAPKADYATVGIILLMISTSAVISYTQSRRSDKAAEHLQQLVANTCAVYRDGELVELEMAELVVGDIVSLSSGDMFPADVRLIETKDLFISQSALTGESQPLERFAKQQDTENIGICDLANLGLLGADVVSGRALAVVIATGENTYFSSVANAGRKDQRGTSYSRGVASISKLLLRMMLVVTPIIFLLNGVRKGDLLQALLFTVSVAVGLTPELLPVIMTTTLSRGAVKMSREKVIVRQLRSIQTFGEMDILCTDKTGTLTEDRITVEKYLDIHGNDDKRVLRHAFLNSYFQTGLKNLLDVAIINRAEQRGLADILERYERKDEIPFDFDRRRMSVVVQDTTGKRQLVTKGAVEEMLSICSFVEVRQADQQIQPNQQIQADQKSLTHQGPLANQNSLAHQGLSTNQHSLATLQPPTVIPLGEREKELALATHREHNAAGLRMIAVAQKNEVPDENRFSVEDESDMVLIGFVAFLDPPKASAAAAIDALTAHGVRTIVLTGDSEGVAKNVCAKVNIDADISYDGVDVEGMDDDELRVAAQKSNLFAKLSPLQKERVIKILQEDGHTVGYLGDGINDTPALRAADVGISVEGAVDIAKETADIVLLEKNLLVLERGIEVGRETFGNITKYLHMAVSGNLGNIISVIFASIFLPFLPLLPVQLLAQNLLNDFAQMGIAFDRVDDEYTREPKSWNVASIKRFMLIFGPLSAVFDLLLFGVLYFGFGFRQVSAQAHFQVAWFLFGTLSQIMVSYVIRTRKIPFYRSRPHQAFIQSTLFVTVLTFIIVLSPIAQWLDMAVLTVWVLPVILLNVLLYLGVLELCKVRYLKKFEEWT